MHQLQSIVVINSDNIVKSEVSYNFIICKLMLKGPFHGWDW